MSARDQILDLKARMGQSIIGQSDVIERLIIGLLANGNLLVEGLPGLAKTRDQGHGQEPMPISAAFSSRPTCCRPT